MTDADEIRREYARRDAVIDPERYSLRGPANALVRRERERAMLAALARRGSPTPAGLDILEVGCGTGGEIEMLLGLGAEPARVHGIDLRPEAIAVARERVPGAQLVVGDAIALPYLDASFDLVLQSTAFSSMRSGSMRERVAAEMRRVVRSGGVIVSYDFVWNPLNRATVGIGKDELLRLFPGWPIELHRVTLAPPLGRWAEKRSLRLLRVLAAVPALRSHLIAFIDVPV